MKQVRQMFCSEMKSVLFDTKPLLEIELTFCFFSADLYGPKYVQAIHGRFLLAATASTMIGPTLLLNLRKMSENAAIQGKKNEK